jgi:hypothetical protein
MRPAVALRACAGLTVVSLSACGASLGGDDGDNQLVGVDAKVYKDAGIDAPPDARVCVGGTPAMLAPDGSCFGIVSTPMTYGQAKAACAALAPGGHLAYLKTQALDTLAEQFIGTMNIWIGADDLGTEGTFVWADGTALSATFTNWHAGEPNSGGLNATYQEDCAIIAGARIDKQWDDRPCDATEIATSGMFASLCQY